MQNKKSFLLLFFFLNPVDILLILKIIIIKIKNIYKSFYIIFYFINFIKIINFLNKKIIWNNIIISSWEKWKIWFFQQIFAFF